MPSPWHGLPPLRSHNPDPSEPWSLEDLEELELGLALAAALRPEAAHDLRVGIPVRVEAELTVDPVEALDGQGRLTDRVPVLLPSPLHGLDGDPGRIVRVQSIGGRLDLVLLLVHLVGLAPRPRQLL